jgi:hypothetical protein
MTRRAQQVVPRKALLGMALAAVVGASFALGALMWDQARLPDRAAVVTVYKHPQCGCCNKWIAHLEKNGFVVQPRMEVKQSERQSALGVPRALRACHTAIVDGYVVEGHVPASDIRRLLRERPKARGLAVPGMPIGSPGMEQGDRVDPYDVLLLDEAGNTTAFAHHTETAQ